MKHRNAQLREFVPTWQREMIAKHTQQMTLHEHRFGKLGELMTAKQRQSLKRALKVGPS